MEKIYNFDILNNISEHVTLLHLMDSPGNVKHTVSVAGKWIFYLNYKIYLPFTIETLNFTYPCSEKN